MTKVWQCFILEMFVLMEVPKKHVRGPLGHVTTCYNYGSWYSLFCIDLEVDAWEDTCCCCAESGKVKRHSRWCFASGEGPQNATVAKIQANCVNLVTCLV